MQIVLIHMEMRKGQKQQRIEHEYEFTSVSSGQPGSTTNNLDQNQVQKKRNLDKF